MNTSSRISQQPESYVQKSSYKISESNGRSCSYTSNILQEDISDSNIERFGRLTRREFTRPNRVSNNRVNKSNCMSQQPESYIQKFNI